MSQPAMTFPGNYFELILKSNYGGCSETEVYPLRAQGIAAARKVASFIIEARVLLFCSGQEIADIAITSANVIGDEIGHLPASTGGETLTVAGVDEADFDADALCNDPFVTLLFGFNTVGNNVTQRHLRFLRDAWVTDNTQQLTAAITQYNDLDFNLPNGLGKFASPTFQALYDTFKTPGALINDYAAIGNWLATVRDGCFVPREVTPRTNPRTFTGDTFSPAVVGDPGWMFQRVSGKKPGKRVFGKRGRARKWR